MIRDKTKMCERQYEMWKLVFEHEEGKHTEPVKNCPSCKAT